VRVNLLDVGPEEYGDALLCQFGDVSVLVDGGHPGDVATQGTHPAIPDQIGQLLGQKKPPYQVSLLIVTHGHLDHIGCLPALVAAGTVRADWALAIDPGLAWGRVGADAAWDAGLDARTRTLLAALREEPRSSNTDDRSLAQFLQDAVTLEQTYGQMLTTLESRGTHLVRFGADDPSALLRQFRTLGMTILGPSPEHLKACAALIGGGANQVAQAAGDALGGDNTLDPVDAYRAVVSSIDAADASRLGAAVNLQSIVTTFKAGTRSVFMGGDMQFADPQVNDPVINASVAALRQAIKDAGPFSVAKLSHHGSDNAFDEEIFGDFGATKYFGICAGAGSKRHPNPATLGILQAHTKSITWTRTDHNGLSSFDFAGTKPKVTIATGKLNDPVPNSADVPAPAPTKGGPRPGATAQGGTARTRTLVTPQASDVEVTTRIPVGSIRVSVTVDVEPRLAGAPAAAQLPRRRATDTGLDFKLAGGRTLPQLLFVTCGAALERNIGRVEAASVLDALKLAGVTLVEDLAEGADASAALARVRAELGRRSGIKGVVIVGGHDVVPSVRVDCLPANLRALVGGNGDADQFIVWSDDAYGDIDADNAPELAVSRIPDGKSPDLVRAALQASGKQRGARTAGIRNVARPFAEPIFQSFAAGAAPMLVSSPTVFNDSPAYSLDADRVYLMLHGDYSDSKRFWGEQTPNDYEAVNVSNVPKSAGGVIFTGCCWGGLTVDPPAGRYLSGQATEPKTPDGSIALSFLRSGAVAFIGCTGSHYSPTIAPYGYYGGPLHTAFWKALSGGQAPAEALFSAKVEYVRGMPYGQRSAQSQAIGYKIFRQYTCLGLGW
jgi:hypothetical protein